jgi:hypothetical protein
MHISRFARATTMGLLKSMETKIWSCKLEFESVPSFSIRLLIWIYSDKLLRKFQAHRSTFVSHWPSHNADENKLFINCGIRRDRSVDISLNAKTNFGWSSSKRYNKAHWFLFQSFFWFPRSQAVIALPNRIYESSQISEQLPFSPQFDHISLKHQYRHNLSSIITLPCYSISKH